MEIIFSLLRSQLCQRSTSHLLLALSLLELVLTAAKPQPKAVVPTPASKELPAVPEEGEPAQADTSAGPSNAQDIDTPMEGMSLHASSCFYTVQKQYLQGVQPNKCMLGSGGVESYEYNTHKACQQNNMVCPLPQMRYGLDLPQGNLVEAMQQEHHPEQRSKGPSSSTAPARNEGVASSSTTEDQSTNRRLQEAQAAVGKLPIEYLTEVAHILGRPKLNDTASAKTAAVTRLLVECAPQHRGSLLSALQSQLNM